MKKLLSLTLSLIMVVSMITAIPTVSAANSNFSLIDTFESADQLNNYFTDKGSTTVVPETKAFITDNPSKTGINTSDKVLKVLSGANFFRHIAQEQQTENEKIIILNELKETFENTDNWELSSSKDVNVKDGILHINSKSYFKLSDCTTGEKTLKNYTVKFDFKADGDYFGTYLRYKDEKTHYLLQFYLKSGKVILLKKVNNSFYSDVSSSKSITFDENKTYNVEITLNEDKFTVLINGSKVLETTDSSIPFGKTGFKALNAKAQVSNFTVTEFGSATVQEMVEVTGRLVDFGALETFNEIPADITTKERYKILKAELPDEMPMIEPFTPWGEVEIFVSPKGNDKNEGTISKPLKTISKAIEKAKNNLNKGVTIYLREGIYDQSIGLELSNIKATAKNPLFISAYNGEKVSIAGGASASSSLAHKLTDNSVLNRLDVSVREKVYEIDLKEAGFTKIPDIQTGGVNASAKTGVSLSVNGKNMTLARYPNIGNLGIEKVIDTGSITKVEGNATFVGDTEERGFEIGLINDLTPLSWKDDGDIWISGGLFWEWNQCAYNVRINKDKKSIDSKGIPVSGGFGIRKQTGVNGTYYFFNVLEAMDMPGEYYIDRDNLKLYFIPIAPINKDTNIIFSTNSSSVVQVTNCSDIIFNGISFESGGGNGINVYDSTEVIIQNCTVKNFTGRGVDFVRNYRSGVINTIFMDVINTQFYSSVSNDNKDYIPANNFFQNNIVIGHSNQALSALIALQGIGNVVSHNYFTDAYASAVGMNTSQETVYEYNEVVNPMRYQHDSGAFYAGGWQFGKYNHLRYNYVHDIVPGAGSGDTSCFYFDSQQSMSLVYGNVMYNMASGIYSHTGKANTGVNNLIINGSNKGNPIRISGNYFNQGFKMSSQVKLPADSTAFTYQPEIFKKRLPYHVNYIKDIVDLINVYHKDGYVRGEQEDNLMAATDHYYENNIILNCKGANLIPESSVSTMEYINNLELKENPGIVDIENRNFNIKEDSYLFTQLDGFEAPPFDKMGLTENDKYKIGDFGGLEAVLPIDGGKNQPNFDDVTFIWNYAPLANHYRLEIATDKEFKNKVVDEIVYFENSSHDLKGEEVTYYWRVTAYTTGKSIDQTPYVSPVYSFTTMTKEAMNAQFPPNVEQMQEAVDTMKKFLLTVDDEKYDAGTKAEAMAKLSEFENRIPEIENQNEAELFIEEIKQLELWVGNRIKYCYDTISNNVDDWTVNGAVLRQDGNDLVISKSEDTGTGWVLYDKPTTKRKIYKFKMMIDGDWKAWWGITPIFDPLYVLRYWRVFNEKHYIEYQKTGHGIQTTEQNINDEFFSAGKWYDVEIGDIYTDEGVWIYLKLDDNVIFSEFDTEGILNSPGGIQFLVNSENGPLRLRSVNVEGLTPPEIPEFPKK